MTVTLRLRVVLAAASTLLLLAGCSRGELASGPPRSSQTGAASTPATVTDLDPAVAERLDAAIDDAMRTTGVPGAIVGLWSPDGRYVQAFGVADTSTGAPMKVGFYHRIGSVTKTFTVTALLQLVDENKVKLDDPISQCVDGVPDGGRITLRQLARMQSGLHNYSATEAFQKALYGDPRRAFAPRQLLDFAFAEARDFDPGQAFEYFNTNTVLLGLVVEKVGGQPLPDFVEPHAQGYTTNADGKEVVATDWNPSWGWAAGAMTSTLDDLHAWGDTLAAGTMLGPETQEQRLETVTATGLPRQDGYGLGLFDLAGWVGHNGSLPGYQTVVVHLTDKQMTLVIMTNTDVPAAGGEPSTALATAITRVVTPNHVYALGV